MSYPFYYLLSLSMAEIMMSDVTEIILIVSAAGGLFPYR